MGDQFSEWDKFYAAYERSLTAEDAFAKYRKSRKRRKKLPKMNPQQRMQMEYEIRVEKRRVERLKLQSDAAARASAARASKPTTKG